MDIVSGITAATEALKLTKELRDIDREIDKAELKLRLVDLVDRLLEAKEALQDAKERESALQNELRDLRANAEESAKLESDDYGRLFRIGDDGEKEHAIYCNHCYTKEGKLFRLRDSASSSDYIICGNCSFACDRYLPR